MSNDSIAVSTDKTGCVYVFHKDIVAEFLRWIVRQHPLLDELPDLNAIAKDIDEWFEKRLLTHILDGMYEVDAADLRKLCNEAAHTIPSIRILNLSRVEREKGIDVDDPSRPAFISSSRYHRPKREHDFIDLGALANNVSRALCQP